MISYRKENLINSPLPNSIKIFGKTNSRMSSFFEERIFSAYAKEVVYKEALSAFETQADDDEPMCLWQGEFWGKWVISGCEVYKACGDMELKNFLIQSAYDVMAFAREDGYIGSYKDSLNVFATPEYINWNVWCRKYTLWGLLSCYEISQDQKILDAAARLVLHLFDELDSRNIPLGDTGTFLGMPSCSILKPLLILYRYTEDKRFFAYADRIIKEFENPESRTPQLIENALLQKPFSLWKENPFLWAKVYEMTSCYEGIAEYYRITGEKKYLDACEGYAEIVENYEKNLVGSAGFNDMYANAAGEINAISEPCDSIHLMRLYKDLFACTGKGIYIDRFERIFYNAFLAGVFRDGKWGARGVRGAGRHFYVESQAKFVHNHCCVNNMPRAFMTMTETAVMFKDNTAFINLYEALSLKNDALSIQISDGYFSQGRVEILVTCSEKGKILSLRNPAWSDKTLLCYRGETHILQNTYEQFPLNTGENRFVLEFDMAVKIHSFDREITYHKKDQTRMYRRFLTQNHPYASVGDDVWLEEKRCTVTRGPLILCKSKLTGSSEKEIFHSDFLIDPSFTVTVQDTPRADSIYCGILTFEKENLRFSATVCDYASSGSEKLSDDKYFSIYF